MYVRSVQLNSQDTKIVDLLDLFYFKFVAYLISFA